MVNLGIIELAEPSEGQVVSSIFLRPKKDGSYRMILDLTWVNEHADALPEYCSGDDETRLLGGLN